MDFTITLYDTIISNISKIRQRSEDVSIVKKSTSQVGDFILDSCVKISSYLIKTVGGENFWNYLTDTDRRTDDGHRVMGKALADIVSWANKDKSRKT